jgi:hypothetical protein
VLVLRNLQLLACYSAEFKCADIFEPISVQTQRHFLNADVLTENHKQQVKFEVSDLVRTLGNSERKYLIF